MVTISKKTKLLLLALVSGFILILISYPLDVSTGNGSVTYGDKFVHGVMFAVFSFLVLYYFDEYREFKFYFISIFLGLLFSLLTEYIQTFLPTRESSEYDLMAGFAGVILINIYVYFRKRFKKT